MQKFILRLLLYCLLPLPLLAALDYAVDAGLHRSRYLYYADWSDLYGGRINADMLVMGTSRAWKHASPRVLDSALDLHCYNLGMDGASADLQADILRLYLRHNRKPRYILQEISYPTLVRSDSAQYYEQLAAYFKDSAAWAILKRHYASAGPADRYFPLYKYNNQLPLIAEGLLSCIGRGAPETKYKGYQGSSRPWDSSFHQFKLQYPAGKVMPIDTAITALFCAYVDSCTAQGIQVILFCAPTYYESAPYIRNYAAIQRTIAQCALACHVPLLNYTYDSISYNKALFYNTQHLNRQGAELFSRKLAADVRPYLR